MPQKFNQFMYIGRRKKKVEKHRFRQITICGIFSGLRKIFIVTIFLLEIITFSRPSFKSYCSISRCLLSSCFIHNICHLERFVDMMKKGGYSKSGRALICLCYFIQGFAYEEVPVKLLLKMLGHALRFILLFKGYRTLKFSKTQWFKNTYRMFKKKQQDKF